MDAATYILCKSSAKKYTDQVTQSLMGGVHYRGSVNYYADLPNDAQEGDSYTVKYAGTSGSIADGTEYTWGYDTDSQTYAWISFSKDAYSKAETDDTFVKKVDEYNAGKTVPKGTTVTYRGNTYTVEANAEIFNNYNNNIATGMYSHAEGVSTAATGYQAHAEGAGTWASGMAAHAEGSGSVASGDSSHAEGASREASGSCSHAEGGGTLASGNCAHAEGGGTVAGGTNSHAEGASTIASSDFQHAEGKWNVEDANDKFAHIIGNGTANNARSNAYAVDWDGKIYTHNSATGFDINSNYLEMPNGVRLYISATQPTGARTGDLWIGG